MRRLIKRQAAIVVNTNCRTGGLSAPSHCKDLTNATAHYA